MVGPARCCDRRLEDPDRLERVGAVGRPAALQIPELPGRAVHDRLGEERRDVEIVGMRAINLAHGTGIVVVPDRADLVRLVSGVAMRERADQHPFDGARMIEARHCAACRVIGKRERALQVDGIEGLPLLVVVWTRRVGDAPMGEGAAGVGVRRKLEAAYRFLMVVAVAPDEPAIEPELRLGRCRRERAAIVAEIVIACHLPLPAASRAGRSQNDSKWATRPDLFLNWSRGPKRCPRLA